MNLFMWLVRSDNQISIASFVNISDAFIEFYEIMVGGEFVSKHFGNSVLALN